MYNGLLHAHSGLRWVALVLILAAIFKAVTSKNKPYTEGERKLGLFTLIAFHTQGLIGLYLYFTSAKVNFMEGFMKEPVLRFFNIEHIVGMIIGVTFITIGYSKAKKKEEANAKRKQYIIWFTLGLVFVLASIPWPFREALGGKWF